MESINKESQTGKEKISKEQIEKLRLIKQNKMSNRIKVNK